MKPTIYILLCRTIPKTENEIGQQYALVTASHVRTLLAAARAADYPPDWIIRDGSYQYLLVKKAMTAKLNYIKHVAHWEYVSDRKQFFEKAAKIILQ